MKRTLTALLLTLAIFLQACGEFNFQNVANRVANVADEAIPIVEIIPNCSACPGIVTSLKRVRDDSRAAAAAEAAGDNTTALDKAASVTRIIEALIDIDTKLLPAGKQTLVRALLAVADLAIREIVDHLQSMSKAMRVVVSRGANRSAQVMQDYAKKARLQCRSSVSGKFEKMSFCKSNPTTSTVERY